MTMNTSLNSTAGLPENTANVELDTSETSQLKIEDKSNVSPQVKIVPGRVNLDAHEGLRGIAALWVMVFHCFEYSTYPIDFMGSSLMPLFFVLTSLTLTVSYNKLNPSQEEIKNDLSASAPKNSIINFYNNRIIRVAPVYYLMNFALALPFWNYGFGSVPNISYATSYIATTATFTSTLLGFMLGSALDGPSWTVQTFMFLWLVYPFFLRRARQMEPQQLKAWIGHLYYIQLIALFVFFMYCHLFWDFGRRFALQRCIQYRDVHSFLWDCMLVSYCIALAKESLA